MIAITQIALFVASAALMVSAGPTNAPVLEAIRSPEPEALALGLNLTTRELDFDPRSITDASDPRLQKRNGELYCGTFATAEFYNAHDLVQDIIHSPGTMHTIPARGCLRTGCKNTSGFYVCNDRASSLTVSNAEINKHVVEILQKCCIHKKDGSPNLQQQTGGQQFTDALGGGWNVVIAYANCNHSPYQIPSTYNGGTVNGPGCLPAQFYIGIEKEG